MAKVFIDGEAGTTGLQILDRLKDRGDLDLLHLGDDRRKDSAARAEMLNEADISILCLPEDASREAVALIYGAGLSNKDAADVLQVSVKALESLLVRARKALRGTLREEL